MNMVCREATGRCKCSIEYSVIDSYTKGSREFMQPAHRGNSNSFSREEVIGIR